jgi:post-segregation antitoxin (ccd killing protein)
MKQTKVFLSDSLSAELLARARSLGMSLSGYIRAVLAKMIDDQRKDAKP